MGRTTREWNEKFIEYMEMIANHENYKGLPIERKVDGSLKWFATKKTKTGKKRMEWALAKAHEFGIPNEPGVYADVMLAIHPTKWKVCQTCGREMSLYYHYPNANFLKGINKEFNTNFSDCDHISDIWDTLLIIGVEKNAIAKYLITKGGLDSNLINSNKDDIISALEYACRKGNKKCLGPGAMSNFPDRYDGFHTYNRCCRASQDKGRSKENLKSYTKDRRAYEYWSDGNIHAANQFMGSPFFDGVSADHIGPISLGFVHDPRYLQPMRSGDNSSKRDRLLYKDIEKIIETEQKTKVYPMSWQSSIIWEYIKKNYKVHPELIESTYRDALKLNMANYMYILFLILVACNEKGAAFLIESFLKPHYDCFKYTYSFNEKGEIINQVARHFTERNQNEIERYNRIAIESVHEYHQKENRNTKPDLTSDEKETVKNICFRINQNDDFIANKKLLTNLIEGIENRIISEIKGS